MTLGRQRLLRAKDRSTGPAAFSQDSCRDCRDAPRDSDYQ